MSHQSAQEVAEGLGVMLVLPGSVRRCGAECSPTRKGRTLHARVLGTTLHQGAQTGGKELIPQAL